MNKIKEKQWYRWVVCVGCFLISFMSYGLAYCSMSLYTVPICEAYGFSRGQFSIVMSILSLSMSLGSFLYSRAIQKFNLKFLMIMGVIFIPIGLLIMGFVSSLPMFYIASAFIGLGLSMTTVIPSSILMLNWFGDKRGGALGIILAASGIGAMVFSPVITYLIDLRSFTFTLPLSAGVLAIILIPIAVFVIAEKPITYQDVQSKEKSIPEISGLSFKEAKKTITFYLCAAAVSLYGIVFVGVTYFVPSYLTDVGLMPVIIGIIISVLSGANAIGKMIMGKINDIWNINVCIIYGSTLFIVSMMIVLMINSQISAVFFAIVYGLSVSLASFPLTIMVSNFFGEKAYGEILSFIQGVSGLVSALAIPVAGFMYDRTGSYDAIFMIYIILGVISFTAYFIAVKKKPAFVKSASELLND